MVIRPQTERSVRTWQFICCGKWALNRPDGIVYTASGAIAEEGVTIAADWSVYSPGTILYIEGMAQAQIEANKRFRKKSYDRIEITVPKGDREKIVQAASAAGMSVNAFIKEALAEYIAHTTKK